MEVAGGGWGGGYALLAPFSPPERECGPSLGGRSPPIRGIFPQITGATGGAV